MILSLQESLTMCTPDSIDNLVFHSFAIKHTLRASRSGVEVILGENFFHYSVLQVPCSYDGMLALRIMNYAP